MTGMLTASMIPMIISGSDMRATPPAARISDGTRSSAITATAPASSAILAWSGVTTSMMTPPLSIWARPFLVAQVDVSTVMWGEFLLMVALGSPAGSGPGVLARSSRPSPARSRDYRTSAREVQSAGFRRAFAADAGRCLWSEAEPRHVVGEDGPGEGADRPKLPESAFRP